MDGENETLSKFLDEMKGKLVQLHDDTKAILEDRDKWQEVANKLSDANKQLSIDRDKWNQHYLKALDWVVDLKRELEQANLKIKQLEAAVVMKEAVEKANG